MGCSLWLSVAVCLFGLIVLVLGSGLVLVLAEGAEDLVATTARRDNVVGRFLRVQLRGMGAALPQRPRFLLRRSDDPWWGALSV